METKKKVKSSILKVKTVKKKGRDKSTRKFRTRKYSSNSKNDKLIKKHFQSKQGNGEFKKENTTNRSKQELDAHRHRQLHEPEIPLPFP